MRAERSFGLQWRLAVICLAAGAISALTTLIVFLLAGRFGLELQVSILIAILSGFLIGFAAAVGGSIITRSVKLRLWEAGRMAGRIARGDYKARVETGPADEVGWLEEQLNLMAIQLESAVGALKDLAERNLLLSEEAGRGAALEERMRLARDLHDTVNQQLFVLAMRAAALKKKIESSPDDISELTAEIGNLEAMARQAHIQIRELILQLRPVRLDREGLGKVLKEYIKKLAEQEGWMFIDRIDSEINLVGDPGESLFRIAQEALNNISKHADAETVEAYLSKTGDLIEMSVSDNGAGFDLKSPANPAAVGLSGIRERVEAIGGQMVIESFPGRGTKIGVTLSLKNKGSEKM
jgi:two-component system, NarL family, sensor histidine kinase LiaS